MTLADQCNYMKRELRKTSNKSTGHRCDRKLLSRKWDPWGTDRWSFEVLAHYQVGQPSLHLLKYLYISVFLKARKALKRGPAWIPDDSIHWTPFIFPSHTSHRHEHLGMPTQLNSYPKNLPTLSPATVWKWNKNCSFNGIFWYSTNLYSFRPAWIDSNPTKTARVSGCCLMGVYGPLLLWMWWSSTNSTGQKRRNARGSSVHVAASAHHRQERNEMGDKSLGSVVWLWRFQSRRILNDLRENQI